MTFKKFLSVFVLTFFVKFGFSQVYQSMPQYGYGPVKRMDFDSTLTIPTFCGVPSLKSNILRKSAIAFDTCNNRFYYYNSKTLVWDTIKGGGSTIDTANKWVNSVTKVNDSTIRVVKGVTTTDIVINPQATRLVTEVYNKTGSQISKGAVVYIDGKHSNNMPSIALAIGNSEANSYKTFALVADNIPNMSSGYVIQAGEITGLNLPTSTYTDGDIVYLSATIAGGYTTTKPLAPSHIVKLGSIVNAHPTQGKIQIKIENGWQLDELSDVSIAAVPADSTILQFKRTDSLWHDVSITNAIGNKYIKPTDTATMLSTYQRSINAVKYSDTASMLTNYAKTSLVNLKVNISDTSSMLTNYAKTSVVNTKLNTSDSSTYFTKYRSDTMRTNIYGQLAQELNISDTATMLSKYLRKTDTTTLSSRIDLRMRFTDTATMLTPYQRSNTALGYSIGFGASGPSFLASTTYYFGNPSANITSTAQQRRVYIPQSGTIKACYLYIRCTNVTAPSTNWTISISLNNGSPTTIQTNNTTSQDKLFSNTGLNISVTQGDYIEITTTTPAWTTATGASTLYGTLYIQ